MYTHELFNADAVSDERIKEVTALINSGDIKLQDYRDLAEKAEVDLSDDELIFMIGGLEDDYSAEDIIAVMQSRETGEDEKDEEGLPAETTKAPTVDRWTADTLKTSAMSFAERIGTDIEDVAFDIQEADEKSKRGPAILLFKLEQKWDDDTWNEIPDLDLTQKEADAKKLKNARLIRWSTKDNNNRTSAQDWVQIALTQLPKGAALVKRIEDLKAAGGNKVLTKEQEEFAAWGPVERASELDTCETRLRNVVTRFKRVVRLHRLMQSIEELDNTIRCNIITINNQKGEPIDVTKSVSCIALNKMQPNPKKKGEWLWIKGHSVTVSTFLRLDPNEVAEDAADKFDALWLTKNRGTGAEHLRGYKTPTSPDKFIGMMYASLPYLELRSNFATFQKFFAKEEDEQKDIAEAIETAYEKMGEYYTLVTPFLDKLRQAEREKVLTPKVGGLKKAS